MSQKPRLVLHIGMPKAGSSRIQEFISQNIRAFQDAGYVLCDDQLQFSQNIDVCLPPVRKLKDWGEGDGATGNTQLRECLIQGREVLKPGQSLLISSENLASKPVIPLFKGLDDLFDIHIIGYIRRRDDWLVSSWGQWNLKRGAPLDLAIRLWQRPDRDDYRQIITMWRDTVSVSDMMIKPMHKSAYFQSDQCLDFAARLGVDSQNLDLPGRVNAALPFEISFLLQEYPELFANVHDNSLKDLILDYFPQVQTQAEDVLGYDVRKAIYEARLPEYKWLHKEFFPDMDFETLFGLAHIDPDTQPYRPSPKRMAACALAVSLAIAKGQEERLCALERLVNSQP